MVPLQRTMTRIFFPPTGDGERFYFTAEGGLTAVTADAGKKVWSFDLDKRHGPVLALPEKGLVFAADQTGSTLCVSRVATRI